METVVSNVFDLATAAWDFIVGNSYLLTFAMTGLVFTGIAVIKKLIGRY